MPLLAVVQEEHAAGPASPFEVNFGLFFWTWVVFIALFLALRKFAWPAILRATEERERTIRTQLAEAERMHAEAKAALEEHRRMMAGARDESAALIAEAKTVAQQERESLLAKARQEQDQILERAKREIAVERDRAVAELRREAVDLSLAAASKLVEERMDDEANRRLVSDFLGSLGKGH